MKKLILLIILLGFVVFMKLWFPEEIAKTFSRVTGQSKGQAPLAGSTVQRKLPGQILETENLKVSHNRYISEIKEIDGYSDFASRLRLDVEELVKNYSGSHDDLRKNLLKMSHVIHSCLKSDLCLQTRAAGASYFNENDTFFHKILFQLIYAINLTLDISPSSSSLLSDMYLFFTSDNESIQRQSLQILLKEIKTMDDFVPLFEKILDRDKRTTSDFFVITYEHELMSIPEVKEGFFQTLETVIESKMNDRDFAMELLEKFEEIPFKKEEARRVFKAFCPYVKTKNMDEGVRSLKRKALLWGDSYGLTFRNSCD